ncbi:hypothetical protein ABZX40_01555 [Streptomyces sp. NPDC004610]|uniref:hypothetical protein n=1 Tax=unclassified Streptomyces TaxID=2593676 RepID=UPI0033BD11F1
MPESRPAAEVQEPPRRADPRRVPRPYGYDRAADLGAEAERAPRSSIFRPATAFPAHADGSVSGVPACADGPVSSFPSYADRPAPSVPATADHPANGLPTHANHPPPPDRPP